MQADIFIFIILRQDIFYRIFQYNLIDIIKAEIENGMV